MQTKPVKMLLVTRVNPVNKQIVKEQEITDVQYRKWMAIKSVAAWYPNPPVQVNAKPQIKEYPVPDEDVTESDSEPETFAPKKKRNSYK